MSKLNPISAAARLRFVLAAGALLALTACGALDSDSSGGTAVVARKIGPASPAGPQARIIGDGGVTVAMLLPISAGGSASGLAQSFQNAAELAMNEVTQDNVRIVVRDTGGDTEIAQQAAERSVAEGTKLILGPVFAPAVAGAGGPARAASVPVIAFSTDASIAGRGVYLLSFLPRQDATRVVGHAASNGVRTYAGLVPDNGYGLVMEAAFREAVASAGGRVTLVQKYAPGEIAAAARQVAAGGAVQAVFVPNGGDDPGAAAAALSSAGVNARLLGSGQWDNPAVLRAPALAGAWFPGSQKGGFEAFAQRYEARYSVAPPRTASLVYDAALLANGLVGARGNAAFSTAALENRDGFIGVDGIFRLTGNGLSERGLAVYEVTGGGEARVVSPAPTQFGRTF
ncbi:penicillin-binding protein activator [Acuticoccus sp. MNP-M23]|uniref:penicillin-binding protein activator n=1 Tax=Acuticoccus sp. MNP-M23 TaxID=3072793 RepID=UPI00281566DD|nr:penicillin-binding protein activator [Acuticoccus sp. MNP-M23]WMS44817.1 penicillin-binding protein activator [Acuticoccus sp. MNP-M23]